MDSARLAGPLSQEKAAHGPRITGLRTGLLVLRPVQIALSFSCFVVYATALSIYAPIVEDLKGARPQTAADRTVLSWLSSALGLYVVMLLVALATLASSIMGLIYTIHQRLRRPDIWLCQLVPDRHYTLDMAADITTAVSWLILLITGGIIDGVYMAKLGVSAYDVQWPDIAVAMAVVPALALATAVVSAVLAGLLRRWLLESAAAASADTQLVVQTYLA